MCGLAGLIHCGAPDVLRRMMLAVSHRGPDSDGLEWFSEHGSGFGHCRLAILDLSPTGHQPMATPDGRQWIVFNGEIYNFQELREELRAAGYRFRSTGDTEMVLYAWQEWGVKCLHRFNGMFAFAIFDTQSGQLFAARDPVGTKPLYYWQKGELIQEDRRGVADHAMVIWSLLTLELWYRTYFDNWTGVAPARGATQVHVVSGQKAMSGPGPLVSPAASLNALQEPGTNVK